MKIIAFLFGKCKNTLYLYIIIITQILTTMKTQILNTEKIEATEFSMEANVVTLDSIPSIKEQNELFIDDSIVLEF